MTDKPRKDELLRLQLIEQWQKLYALRQSVAAQRITASKGGKQ